MSLLLWSLIGQAAAHPKFGTGLKYTWYRCGWHHAHNKRVGKDVFLTYEAFKVEHSKFPRLAPKWLETASEGDGLGFSLWFGNGAKGESTQAFYFLFTQAGEKGQESVVRLKAVSCETPENGVRLFINVHFLCSLLKWVKQKFVSI